MDVDLRKIQMYTSPNPFALVSTSKKDKSTNLMAISWWTYVSNKPATVAVCISKKSFTNEMILENKEFGLNIVDESLQESAFLCGTCSGRDVNKPEKFNISLIPSQEISVSLVEAHKVALECSLVETIDVSDHSIFIGRVVACQCNPERKHLYAMDGYRSLDVVLKS